MPAEAAPHWCALQVRPDQSYLGSNSNAIVRSFRGDRVFPHGASDDRRTLPLRPVAPHTSLPLFFLGRAGRSGPRSIQCFDLLISLQVDNNEMMDRLQTLGRRLQVDRSLGFVLASRVWQAVSGPLTIWFLVNYLTIDQQGIYYGIFSFVAIQAFFELGLLTVLVGFAGHEATALAYRIDGQVVTACSDHQAAAAARVRELLRASTRWFGLASSLFAVVAFGFGWYTLSNTHLTTPVAWQLPLMIVVPCAALTVFWSPRVAILEGIGFRETVYRFRLYQAITGSLAVWATLVLGLGLWCLITATLTQTLWVGYLSFIRYRSVFEQLQASTKSPTDFSWTKDIVPVQWRAALIGVLHHIATQCFSIIILLFHHDAAEAGRLGMTLTVTSAIQMLALAWVQTKYPLAAGLHGAGDRERAGTMWRQATLVSTSLLIVAFAVLVALVSVLPMIDARFENRFITPLQIMILGGGCLANHLLATQAFYVLARRFKPLLITAPSMLVSATAIWIAGYFYSTAGIVTAFAASLTFVVLPLHTWAYLQLRRTNDSHLPSPPKPVVE